MKLLIKAATLISTMAFMSSCTNYNYQKVVVNNSKSDVIIHSGCCGNEEDITVPAFEEKIVFECIYQSSRKPNCDDVEGKFSIASEGQKSIFSKDIANAENWDQKQEGKTISCIFIIDAEK